MLTVYVPAQNSELQSIIEPASGIVGSPVETEEGTQIRIDYEGNLYSADNIKTFGDRVQHAAGRHGEGDQPPYPTVARQVVDRQALIPVGRYDSEQGEVLVEDRQALREWLGLDKIPDAELKAGGATFQRRRRIREALGSEDPRKRQIARQMQKREQQQRDR